MQKKWPVLTCLAVLALPLRALAQTEATTWKEPSPITADVQLGLDYWDVDSSAATALSQTRLFLADSTPQWTYTNASPWLTFEAHARSGADVNFNVKYRGNQSSGGRLDEANVDWSISPFLGLRAGVVDFKTSWCRTYDTDSPWVRENDPFCTVRTTDQATGAAPGVQTYFKTHLASYDVQAVAGIYRPKAWGYDNTEFNNVVILYGSNVEKNHKAGVSLNVVNIETATELRLSWLHSSQQARVRDSPDDDFYHLSLRGDVLYLASSFLVSNKVQVRLSHLRSDMTTASFSYPGDSRSTTSPPLYESGSILKSSSTVELSLQATAQDVLSAAYSHYPFQNPVVKYANVEPRAVAHQQLVFKNNSLSLAWRRDHGRGLFTSVQWTRATMAQTTSGTPANAKGHAVGVRLGYRF